MQRGIVAEDNGVQPHRHFSPGESLLHGFEPATRSIELIGRAGRRLGLDQRVIEEIIHPHEVRVFRLPCHIMGRAVVIPGVMALHNNARGPYKGGVRLSEDGSVWETVELARLMTLKTALVDIEFGGGKSSLSVPWPYLYRTFHPRGCDDAEITRDLAFEKMVSLEILEAFARRFRGTFRDHTYIPAPDLGTGADEMAVIYNETLDPASVTGKAEGIPGSLPGRRESTGFGCACVTLRLLSQVLGEEPEGRTVAIQGFGNVGEPLARALARHGVRIVAVTDADGGVYEPQGLDVEALTAHAWRTGSVLHFEGQPLTNEELLSLPVDVLVPAAVGGAIHEGNASQVRARAVVEAANMPVTLEAMDILARRGIPVLPDILANAGGVIASMEEYSHSLSAVRLSAQQVLSNVDATLNAAFDACAARSREEKIPFVDASVEIALERVWKAMRSRRLV